MLYNLLTTLTPMTAPIFLGVYGVVLLEIFEQGQWCSALRSGRRGRRFKFYHPDSKRFFVPLFIISVSLMNLNHQIKRIVPYVFPYAPFNKYCASKFKIKAACIRVKLCFGLGLSQLLCYLYTLWLMTLCCFYYFINTIFFVSIN